MGEEPHGYVVGSPVRPHKSERTYAGSRSPKAFGLPGGTYAGADARPVGTLARPKRTGLGIVPPLLEDKPKKQKRMPAHRAPYAR